MTLPLIEARRNEEIVSLADSQVLRWIDELNDVHDAEEKARNIRREIKRIRREPDSVANRRSIRRLYNELDEIQFKPDYLYVVIDRVKDYRRACKGFSINGIRYVRLLGTNGGIKNHTIVFVSARLADELRRRIDNGRNPDMPLVPAKLEAYKALTCSASNPVSLPRGILVVSDCETEFLSDIISLSDESDGEPVMEYIKDATVCLDESDGYGLMLPALAERWSDEMQLGYISSAFNTRFSWEKGMVFTFDFLDFANKKARGYIVKDAWGNDVDVRGVELILTTSMLKLWNFYPDCDTYLRCCSENGYTFGITKTAPKKLESERTLNYQFIQSYDLDDDDIERLIKPTMDELKDVLYNDPAKTVLFMKGMGLDDESVELLENDYIKAVMIDRRMMDDPYVQNSVYQAIKKRIDNAKIGVLKVHGNYSIVCGDPYALCQHIFGLPVTGLLRSGEIYNEYWCRAGNEKLACFRAPMTCHNNIRLVRLHRSDEASYWYRYITTCTLFNAWDTAAHAMNGLDKDGDIVMLTDADVLVDRLRPMPSLMCVQRKADQKIVTEDDAIRSNVASFGDDIGKTTNWVTSMYEVQAGFPKGSPEYNELDYRIKCGQLYQQNAIDKAKGIVCKPMPREWHDRHAINQIEDIDKRRFYHDIAADKKPYFMRLIYPALMRQYKKYIKNANKNAIREFRMTIDELLKMSDGERTDKQNEFLRFYKRGIPVGMNDCIMNKICRRFEEEFDRCVNRRNVQTNFDYSIMRCGAEYTRSQYNEIAKLCRSYDQRLKSYALFAKNERVDEYDALWWHMQLREEFMCECAKICPNRYALCDIVLDICYRKNSTKSFAWGVCHDEIINNLLIRNGGIITYPTADENGTISFCGQHFSLNQKKIGVEL